MKYFYYSALVEEENKVWTHCGVQENKNDFFDLEKAYYGDSGSEEGYKKRSEEHYSEVTVISFQEIGLQQYILFKEQLSNYDYGFLLLPRH